MANNSATIVAAALDSTQLEQSINKLVSTVAEKTKQMADNFTSEIARMENAVKNLGNIKIDSGGAADGGSSRRTQALKGEEEQIKRNTAATKENRQAVRELTQDQQQAVMQSIARFAQEVRMPDMAKSARESFQVFYKEFSGQARNLESLIKAEENRLSGSPLGRFTQETKSQLSQLDASIDQTRWKMNFLYQEEKRLNQEALKQKVGSSDFEKLWSQKYEARSARVREGERLIELERERQRVIASDPSVQQLDRNIEQVRAKIQQLLAEEKRLQEVSLKSAVGSTAFEKAWNQKYAVRDERIANEERLIQLEKERQSLVAVDPIRTQLLNLDELRSKREKVLGLIHDETTTNNRNTESIQQQAQAQQNVTQSAQRYTEEIRKQAQAIRASKEWQEKGYYRIGEASFYNPETSRLAKKDIISLEEQILRWKQKQTEETDKTTRSEYQYSEAVRSAADALRVQLHGTKAASIDVGGRTIYNEKEAGSIESQLTALMKDRTKEFNLQHEVALAIEQDEKRISEELAKQRQTTDSTKKIKEAETYRQMIAKTLGIQESQVKLANAETASYEQLDATLKQLVRTKNRLGSEGLNSAFGKGLLEDIREVEAAMQRIKKFGYNKVSLSNALGLSEKSLDDIARKSQQLQYVMKNVDTTTEEGARAFQRAALNARLLKEKENELLSKNSQLMSSNNSLIKSNTALGRSWNYAKNRLAFYFTVGASASFVKNLIEVRSQYEMNERALGILINSAERGTQIFNELSQMALVSPYTLIELSSAAKQLTAYDIAAKDVVDTTRRLADMASAVGVPMERLTYALGQIKAYGYLNSRDNRMFANAGIPLVKQLADYYTELEGRLVSTADVYDRIKKKAVGYNEVMDVINRMTDEGGKFFNFQEKMAGTLKVQLANLTLAWNNMLNEIGASQQGVLSTGIGALKNFFLAWKDLANVLTTVAVTFGILRAQMLFANVAIGKQNMSLLRYIANNKTATWTDYTRALQTKKLTAAQASWLIMSNKTNDALAASVIRMKILDAATVRSIRNLNGFSLAFAKLRLSGTMAMAGISKAFKSLGGLLAANVPLLIITGIVDAFTHLNNVVEANKEFNKNIANGAKEASKALNDFLNTEDKVQARAAAQTKSLSQTEANKVWEAIREQIELSALSAKELIPQLLDIPDINERVSAGFNLAERIQDAIDKLADLEDELSVEQDSWLWGAFGEGLAEDIEDYTERRKQLHEQAEFFAKNELNWWEELKIAARGVWDGIGKGAGQEAFDEISEFANKAANVIKQRLGEDGSKDAEKVSEAIARVMAEVEKNPKISGAGKDFFESTFVSIMGSQFSGVFDVQKHYYTVFLEQLKRDYSNTFRNVTDDIINNAEHKWNPAQIKAIEETAKKIKKDMPQASRDAIDEIVKQLNEKTFKLRFVATFELNRSELQRQFDKSFGDPMTGVVMKGYETIRPKENEDFLDYRKSLNKTLSEGKTRYAELKAEADANRKSNKALAESLDEEARKQNEVNKAAQVVKNTWHLLDEEKERNKAQKQAESELAKALKDELSTIEKVRSIYKELTKEGMSHADAVKSATEGWNETVNAINKVLTKNGLKALNLADFVGIDNPREILNTLQAQLEELVKRGASTSEIKVLQEKINTVRVDADKYDLTKITKGLNSELDRLKEEYELAVSLDADPELGSMFADWMGIDVNDLPRTAQEYAEEASKVLNSKLKELGANVELPNLLSITDDDLRAFEQNKILTQEQLELVKKRVEESRGFYKKEVDDRIKGWNTLLEKYAEYETKVNKIRNDATKERVAFAQQFGNDSERATAIKLQTQILATTDPNEKQQLIQQLQELVKSIAGDDKTKINLVTSINNSEQQGLAKAGFEEFQKSPEWITATGDLAGMTNKAIGYLIDSLEKYKKSAKNLNPKQIKQINSALRSLHKQQRQGNPFMQIADAIDTAKSRAEEFQPEMDAIMSDIIALEKEIIALEKEIGDNDPTEEQAKHLKSLKDRWKELASVGKVSASEYVDAINNSISAASQAISMFTDMADALGGQHMTEASKTIKDVVGVLEKAAQGAAMGAQIGGGYGAIIGAVAGALAGAITTWADVWSGNAAITDKVKESERAVKHLDLAYIDLQQAVDEAYGTAAIGAKQATLANKELQLAEIQRQIQLEKSRSSKNRDEDKIIDLQKQYKELFYEIKNGYTEIVDDLMGTDVASFAENLVSSMIDAFKQGEDYMKVFSDKFDEMIDNMIMKSIVSRVVSQYLNAIWEDLNKLINERTKEESEDFAAAQTMASTIREMSDDEIRKQIATQRWGRGVLVGDVYKDIITQKEVDEYRRAAEDEEKAAQKRLDAASAFTDSDIDYVMGRVTEIMPELGEKLQNILGQYYKFGESSETQLSALQQGLQSMSESTANALEAYANSISQQAYYHSSLLEQIRDSVVGLNLDVSLGVQSQILLQLQNSYQTQQAIQQILEGVLVPSGRAFAVELIS